MKTFNCRLQKLCFRCLNSDLYISTNQVCDGIFDCPDLSDECLCQHELKTSTVCKNFCLQPKGEETLSRSEKIKSSYWLLGYAEACDKLPRSISRPCACG